MLYDVSELVLTAGERVRSRAVVAEGVRLETATRSVVLSAEPDERSARRVCGLATRVNFVEIFDPDGERPVAEVTAVWHRVPHARPVTLGAAAALALSGVPTYLHHAVSR